MNDNQKRRLGERHAVRGLLKHLKAAGWLAWSTWDGEERQITLGNEDAVMAAAFNLDECSIRFAPVPLVLAARRAHADHAACRLGVTHDVDGAAALAAALKAALRACDDADHGALVVFGNSPEEVISDWNYSDGDADGFNAAMESYTAWGDDNGPLAKRLEDFSQSKAAQADQIAVPAYPPNDRDMVPVLVKQKGRTLRRIGEVRTLEEARILLDTCSVKASSVTMDTADDYPGGWARRYVLAEV